MPMANDQESWFNTNKSHNAKIWAIITYVRRLHLIHIKKVGGIIERIAYVIRKSLAISKNLKC